MVPVAQLVDQGVRAYVEGRLDDARRILDEVLQRDPANSRARSYLILLHDLPTTRATPVPAPAPVPVQPRAQASAAAAAQASTPATAPAPAWELAPVLPTVEAEHEEYAPSPWDDGPAAGATIVLGDGGGLDLDAVAEKSDLRPLVPESTREAFQTTPSPLPATVAAVSAVSSATGPRRDVDIWLAASKDLHALGDFSGSLVLIEKILRVDPEHPEARAYLEENEATLVAMYESKLGPLGGVPRLAIKPEEVMWLNLDHRAGFLLSQIDGAVDYESLFALSGLPRLDTARILATLISDGVITS